MERRNRSLKALNRLVYIDSLDNEAKAQFLTSWVADHLMDGKKIEDFDLELKDLQKLHELFYKNIKFLKHHREDLKKELASMKDIKKFLS
ncbi:MAG: hypothetical protein IE909_01675 [Campylobacterales bacterium]|nr:hypothetical protein [Campylobacterales bacterium]